jgi:hypothetical protein
VTGARAGGAGRTATAVVLSVVAAVVAVGMLAVFVGGGQRSRADEAGSVANKGDDGVFGFAGMLNRLGWRVGYVDAPFDTASLPPTGTVVVVDPRDVGRDEPQALADWVAGAAERRVVLVAADDGGLRDTLVPGLRDVAVGREVRPSAAVAGPVTDGLDRLGVAVSTGWRPVDGDAPTDLEPLYVLDAGDASADAQAPPWYVVRRRVPGGGEVIAVRDTAVLDNAGIIRGNNAAFALRLPLPVPAPVVFDEFHHTPPGGGGLLDAAPADVRALALQALVVFVLLVAALAVRFGPPLRVPDTAPPRRIAYVDALARALRRSRGDAEAFAVVRHDLRVRLLQRTRLPTDTSDAALVDAAVALGCDRAKVTAVLGGALPTDAAAATRATAWAAECRAVLERPPVGAG